MWASLVSLVKNLPANVGDTGDTVRSLGREDHLEEEMATHPSILAGKIPWTEEPGKLRPWVAKSLTQLSMHARILIQLLY